MRQPTSTTINNHYHHHHQKKRKKKKSNPVPSDSATRLKANPCTQPTSHVHPPIHVHPPLLPPSSAQYNTSAQLCTHLNRNNPKPPPSPPPFQNTAVPVPVANWRITRPGLGLRIYGVSCARNRFWMACMNDEQEPGDYVCVCPGDLGNPSIHPSIHHMSWSWSWVELSWAELSWAELRRYQSLSFSIINIINIINIIITIITIIIITIIIIIVLKVLTTLHYMHVYIYSYIHQINKLLFESSGE